MMKWLRKKYRYQGPDQLAEVFRRGMSGGTGTENVRMGLPQLKVPSVIDSIPVFTPPQEVRR